MRCANFRSPRQPVCPVRWRGAWTSRTAGAVQAAPFRKTEIGVPGILDIYLPIAEVSLDVFVLLGLGAAVGFLSGVFGVGGGFLLTPLLIFIGVPPAVAVASSANQLVGASVSGVLAHWRRGNVDFKMGCVAAGRRPRRLGARRLALHASERLGQVELVISLLLRAAARRRSAC